MGADFRHEDNNDPQLNPNSEYQNLGLAITKGSRNVSALFGEVHLPIIKQFHADISARFDRYSDFGSSFNPKIGLKWIFSKRFALRGTASRGFVAPSFSQIATSSSVGFSSFSIPPDTLLYKEHDGDNYVSVPYSQGGGSIANPNIKPERSFQWTLGAIFAPTRWLSGTLDYYSIRLSNLIGGADSEAALDDYMDGLSVPSGFVITPDVADPLFPNAIRRPTVVSSPFVNGGDEKTEGVDLNLRAEFPVFDGTGVFRSSINATKILSWSTTLADGSHYQFAGTQGPYGLSSGAGTPRYRAVWSNTLTKGPWSATAEIYYTSGEFMSTPESSGPGCSPIALGVNGVPVPANCRMASFTDVNLTGKWQVSRHVAITGAVFNLFDRPPPLDVINYAQVNYNPTYDEPGIVGRFYKLGATFTF